LTVVVLVFINVRYLRIAKLQAEAANAQARESQRQADAAMESLKLLKAEAQQRTAQELSRVIAILRGMSADVALWKPIVKERWGTAPSTIHLIPDDWPLVVYYAGTVSPELREKALDVYTKLANANYQITQFLSTLIASRNPSILEPAYLNLENATPDLMYVIGVLESVEQASARTMRVS
jgi:hypothetical protein